MQIAHPRSVWKLAAQSWFAATLVTCRLPKLILSTLALVVLQKYVTKILWDAMCSTGTHANQWAFKSVMLNVGYMFVHSTIMAAVAAPQIVGATRFIVLGEENDRVAWSWRPEVLPVFVWTTLTNIFTGSFAVYAPPRLHAGEMPSMAQFGPLTIAIICIYLTFRLRLVTPWTAVDPRRVSLKNSWRLNQARFWYILGSICLSISPIAILRYYDVHHPSNGVMSRLYLLPSINYWLQALISASVGALLLDELMPHLGGREKQRF
jgi:hypothetical protein